MILSGQENEHTWSSMDEELLAMTKWFQSPESEHQEAARLLEQSMDESGQYTALLQGISRCITSERSRLSGTALELVQAIASATKEQGTRIMDLFLPQLFKLSQRANKVFVQRSHACLNFIWKLYPSGTCARWIHTHHLKELLSHANKNVRVASAQCILRTLEASRADAGLISQWSETILESLRLALHDPAPEVRSQAMQAFPIFQDLFQDQAHEFMRLSSPHTQKILKFKENRISPSPLPIKLVYIPDPIVPEPEVIDTASIPVADPVVHQIVSPVSDTEAATAENTPASNPQRISIPGPVKIPPPPQRLGTAVRMTPVTVNVAPQPARAPLRNQAVSTEVVAKSNYSIRDKNWAHRVQAISSGGLHSVDDCLEILADHHPRVLEAAYSCLKSLFPLFMTASPNKQAQLVVILITSKKQELLDALLKSISGVSHISCASVLSLACSMVEPHHPSRRLLISMVHSQMLSMPLDAFRSRSSSLEESTDSISVQAALSCCSLEGDKASDTLAFKTILAKLPWTDRHHAADKNIQAQFKEILGHLYHMNSHLFAKSVPSGSHQAVRGLLGLDSQSFGLECKQNKRASVA